MATTLRVCGLAAVAFAAAFAAVAAGSQRAPALDTSSPALAAPAPARCPASAGPAAHVDVQLEHLVAPVTIAKLARPLRATPPLGRERRVFPLVGSYPGVFDTWGAPRAGVSWHHGDDLFTPRGTPVLAVADGVVFSVGPQRLGGLRLWLLDRRGNEYYYAHLERYAPLARDGEVVRAGELLGYVGTTGDAEGTPPHLHFEVHPAALLGVGYDGAVDPTGYLRSWRQLRAAVRPIARSCGR